MKPMMEIDWTAIMRGQMARPLRTPTLAEVQAAQRVLGKMPQVPLDDLEHEFAPGMYVRTLNIPAGLVVVGKQHRHAHPVFLLKGECTIQTDKGMERIKAPRRWVSQPGAKRILLTHTDCEFTTVHLNADDTHDVLALEQEIITPEPQLTQDAPEIGPFHQELQEAYA